ncbi:MAG: YdiU family protein [Myxococcales bacterium]|nr:YdiU family protein [Myxococcales bacterium]
MTPEELLDARRWDALPLLGAGATAQVLRCGAYVVKVAHPSLEARARLREEPRLRRLLAAGGVPVAEIHASRRDGSALVRDFLHGPPLAEELISGSGELEPKAVRQLFSTWTAIRAVEERWGVRVDFSPSNLYRDRGRFVLADAGERVAPPLFRARELGAFASELRGYVRFKRRQDSSFRVREVLLPPSGRFHVEVPVGPWPKGKVLWVNEGLRRRLGLPWSERFVFALGNLGTLPKATSRRVSTRYMDMLRVDRLRGPKGDGRTVYLGKVRTALGPKELTLKGCGPTPLAWKGRRFHEDGFVSFPRALWEVTVADELARLGFETPEYLALLSTGQRTADNTLKVWPAAAGIRVSRTHLRLGHLKLWTHRPEAFRAMLAHVGRELIRGDFNPLRASHVRALVLQFAKNLGHDVGRTDALQIHCFNPTPGNVRMDGHFIDYSTVRFFRQYVPDFRFLEGAYRVRIHRAAWMRQVRTLVESLEESSALAPAAAPRLGTAALRAYQSSYVDGFMAGLARLFGFPVDAGTAAERRRLVRLTQELRELRDAGRELVFRYWKQRCPAPLFDLAGRAPELMKRWRRRWPESWRALLARPGSEVTAATRRLGQQWVEAAAPFLRRARRPALRWREIIRPQLEPESLARMLYGRSRPRSFEEWKAFISTSRHLPEGTWSYPRAGAWARRLGHVLLPGLQGGAELLVGVTPELLGAIQATLERILGRRLVGAVAHGSRVMERGQLMRAAPRAFRRSTLKLEKRGVREYGPRHGFSSDLDLKVFVRAGMSPARRDRMERELGAALEGLGAWFPLSGHQPPRQRLIETACGDVVTAFRGWNGLPRRQQLGKSPICEVQVVMLHLGCRRVEPLREDASGRRPRRRRRRRRRQRPTSTPTSSR